LWGSKGRPALQNEVLPFSIAEGTQSVHERAEGFIGRAHLRDRGRGEDDANAVDLPGLLVVTASEMTVYLLEDGKPHDNKGASIRAVVQQGGKSTTIEFATDDKKLVAKLSAPIDKGAIVVLTGKDEHDDPINALHVIN
jgi:hypothetical protein